MYTGGGNEVTLSRLEADDGFSSAVVIASIADIGLKFVRRDVRL